MDPNESNVAAFIDMDYTLYKKHPWQALPPCGAGR
jgi:hypothetical protein